MSGRLFCTLIIYLCQVLQGSMSGGYCHCQNVLTPRNVKMSTFFTQLIDTKNKKDVGKLKCSHGLPIRVFISYSKHCSTVFVHRLYVYLMDELYRAIDSRNQHIITPTYPFYHDHHLLNLMSHYYYHYYLW